MINNFETCFDRCKEVICPQLETSHQLASLIWLWN